MVKACHENRYETADYVVNSEYCEIDDNHAHKSEHDYRPMNETELLDRLDIACKVCNTI